MAFRRVRPKPPHPARKSASLFPAAADAAPPDLIAHIDGGARGNPGPAGYGVIIEDASGRKLAELSEYLGERTNNWAEYSALLAALEYARAHGGRRLKVLSDSELLVRQMTGAYKVRSPELKALHQRAQTLAGSLESFLIEHLAREQNRGADRLANLAMDRGSGSRSFHPSPASAGPQPELRGVVRGGAVQLEGSLPEGTRVTVRVTPK